MMWKLLSALEFDRLLHQMPYFYIRLGALGEIHRAQAPMHLSRGRRVIVRTPRGVELAEVVSPSTAPPRPETARGETKHSVGGVLQHRILRETTEQDELLIRRLERHKRSAIEKCRLELARTGCNATLIDVDHLFDGGTLVMHFLGPVDALVESITQRIVTQYEEVIRTRHLAKLMQEGCGPGCGDKEAGCGTACSGGACSGCSIASAVRASNQP